MSTQEILPGGIPGIGPVTPIQGGSAEILAIYGLSDEALARTPVYKAVLTVGEKPFSTHRIHINLVSLDESLAVDEAFGIDENKVYSLADENHFWEIDNSPIGDMFLFNSVWNLSDTFPYMKLPQTLVPMQIQPEQGACNVGSIMITLVDRGEEATALMSEIIFGTAVEVYAGYFDWDDEDFEMIYRGTVQSVRMTPELAAFEIQLHNSQTKVNKQLFQSATGTLATDISADDIVLSVGISMATLFQDSGYLLIDDEILYYGDREFATFIFIDRGAFGRTPAAHAAGAAVRELFVIGPAHPIDIILDIYYGTPSKTCLGLGYHEIDWLAFAEARDIIGTDIQMQFFILAAENALQFLNRELFQKIGAYPFVTKDGRVSIKAIDSLSTPDVTFDHDIILGNGGRLDLSWGLGAGTIGQPINDISLSYNYDPTTGKYHSFHRAESPTSISNYGRFPMVQTSAGFRSELAGTATFIDSRLNALLARNENGRPVITVNTHLRYQNVDVGEVVSLTSRFIPNRSTGTRGVTGAKCEVINRSVNWSDGTATFTLLGVDPQL